MERVTPVIKQLLIATTFTALALVYGSEASIAQLVQKTPGGGSLSIPIPPAAGCSQATTFIARTSGENNSALTTLICGLVTDGIITGDLTSGGTKCGALLDRLYIMAMANSTDGLLDVCGNASAVANGSPTFTANTGFTGVDNSSTIYIDTGFNPNTAGGNYSLNSAHLAVWSMSAPATNFISMGAQTSSVAKLLLAYNGTDFYARINDADSDGPTTTGNGSGYSVGSRSGSTTTTKYRNGASVGTTSDTSSATPNFNFYIIGVNNAGTAQGAAGTLGMSSLGANLSSTNVSNFYSRMCTYLTTVHGSC